jgi:hypothetical protein
MKITDMLIIVIFRLSPVQLPQTVNILGTRWIYNDFMKVIVMIQ